MNLRQKQILGFTGFSLSMLLLASINILFVNVIKNNADKIVESSFYKLDDSIIGYLALTESNLNELFYRNISSKSGNFHKPQHILDQMIKTLQYNTQKLESSIILESDDSTQYSSKGSPKGSPKGSNGKIAKKTDQTSEIKREIEKYILSVRHVIDLLEQNQYEAAELFFSQNTQPLYNSISKSFNFMVKNSLNDIFGEVYQIRRHINFGIIYNILLILFGIIFSTSIGIITARTIVKPIMNLKKATVEMSNGDLDILVENPGSNDELAELTTSFNKMAMDLKRTTTSIDGLNQEIEKRKLLNIRLEANQAELQTTNSALTKAIAEYDQMAKDAEAKNAKLIQSMEVEKRIEGELRESEERHRAIIENIVEGYCEVDLKGNITYFNKAMSKILGYTDEELVGMNSSSLVDDKDMDSIFKMFKNVYITNKKISECNFSIKRKDGMKREIATSISLMRDQDGKVVCFMGIVRDVDEQKKHEKQLIHAAYHDALTGLKNRKAFYNRLDETLLHAKRYQHDISLIYIDIDNFKQVNDTLGHEAGDELLREIAKRLTSCLRKTDFVSRIGGDEFTVIIDNFNSTPPETVALKINETLSAQYTVCGSTVNNISSSIGISMFPKDADSSDELIRMADTAMYRAKKERNSFISCGAI